MRQAAWEGPITREASKCKVRHGKAAGSGSADCSDRQSGELFRVLTLFDHPRAWARKPSLSGVVAGLAEHFGYSLRRVTSAGTPAEGIFPADWIILSRTPQLIAPREVRTATSERETTPTILWTDDHSNLFEILK
jgi:hypothetical protein